MTREQREQIEAKIVALWDERTRACAESVVRSGHVPEDRLDEAITAIVEYSEPEKRQFIDRVLRELDTLRGSDVQ